MTADSSRPIQAKRVLVVGGCGFIGSHLVRSLAEHNEVVALDHVPPAMAIAGVDYVRQDLRERIDRSKLPSRLDVVFHLASSFLRNGDSPVDYLSVTMSSVLDALDYATSAGAGNFLFTSSGSVYAPGPTPHREDAPLRPTKNLYVAAKYSAELFVEHYSDQIAAVVTRLFGVYGKGTSNPWGRLARCIDAGDAVRLRRNGAPHINPVYVRDLIPILEAAAMLGRYETINVGGQRVSSNLEAANLMGEVLGKKPVVDWMEDHDRHIVGDLTKMISLFDCRPKWSLEQGLRAWLLHDDEPTDPSEIPD